MKRPASRTDADFAAEVEAHLELEIEQLIAEGMDPEAARHQARRSFGNVTRTQERFYESSRWMWLDHLVRDLRFALRQMKRSPISTATIVCSLALGLGACTAMFSILRPLMLQDLPFEQPNRLVWIENVGGEGMSSVTSRTSNLRDFRALARSFDGMTGFNAFFEYGSYNLVGAGDPIRLVGVGVAADFLNVLGVTPLHGRSFTDEEGQDGGPPAIILSHGFWQSQFAGDPTIVDRAINLDGEPVSVVGVLPPSFEFASFFSPRSRVDFLTPLAISDRTDAWGNLLSIIARLAPGATIASAQQDLDGVIASLEEADPERWGLGAKVRGLQSTIAAPYRSALLLLAAAAGAVLLIVCLNISNMLLARGPRRSAEMAVRSALGAPRRRLLRQLLIESVVLSLTGTLLGALFAFAVTGFVSRTRGLEIPLLNDMTVDGGALLFATLLALGVGVLVGIVPALQLSRAGHRTNLRGSRQRMSASRQSTAWREALVVAEVAVACILLVFGGLLVRSFQKVLEVDPGFVSEGVVTWNLDPGRVFVDRAEAVTYYERIITAIETLPGVEAVGLTDAVPLGRNRTWGITAPGQTYADDLPDITVFPHLVDHRYLDTVQVELVAGRRFDSRDGLGSPGTILLNEATAAVLYQGEEVLGRTANFGDEEFEIIGVVANTRHRSLEVESDLEAYFPITQIGSLGALDMVVRSSLPAETLAAAVIPAIHRVDPTIPANEYRSLTGQIERWMSPRRFTLQVLMAFAAIALLLAALGIYGVLSYSVTERRPEIGIRMALGESARRVLQRVVLRTLTLAAIGLAVGLVASLLISRWFSSLLYGMEATDPKTLAAMGLTLLVVAALAGLIPALRAARTKASSVLWAG
ncbi:MAG: ADOP family duplicated permease [Acidobacteriota bacterium]